MLRLLLPFFWCLYYLFFAKYSTDIVLTNTHAYSPLYHILVPSNLSHCLCWHLPPSSHLWRGLLTFHSKELQQRLRTLLHQLITPTLATIFKVFLLENATTYLFSWMNHDEGNQVGANLYKLWTSHSSYEIFNLIVRHTSNTN